MESIPAQFQQNGGSELVDMVGREAEGYRSGSVAVVSIEVVFDTE